MASFQADEPDYYSVLGVPPDATQDALKRAYRRRAQQLHPDRHPDDPALEEGFKALCQAYRVLSDPKRRADYDRRRQGPIASAPRKSVGDFFRKLFGAQGAPAENGKDLRYRLSVGLAELARGARVEISLPSSRACSSCAGAGSEASPQGDAHQPAVCRVCAGAGRESFTNRLEVQIPPGLEDGTQLKLAAEGEVGLRGGRNGDLYVEIEMEPHPLLTRQGCQLHCQVPIPFQLAVLGGGVEVPSIAGTLDLAVPAGTQSGTVFRLKGQGLPPSGGGRRGDLLIDVRVEVPRGLSVKEQKALENVLDQIANECYPAVERYRQQLEALRKARAPTAS